MKKNSPALHIFLIIIGVGFIMGLDSCESPKNVVYFKTLQRDTAISKVVNENFEVRIRKNDLLNITVVSPDPMTTPLFSGVQTTTSNITSQSSSNANPLGFLVDNEGNISMYKLGKIHVEGLTISELERLLKTDLNVTYAYLKDASVTVRFLSNHVTVLGEVIKPQVLAMPTEKFSILEALSSCQDITFTGRKDNILLIRETPEGKLLKRLNLTDNSIFTSPYYYLKPDDVVIVEPTELKIKNAGTKSQTTSYILTGISIALTLILALLR
jgi:polysaccharide export outer membrane protein